MLVLFDELVELLCGKLGLAENGYSWGDCF